MGGIFEHLFSLIFVLFLGYLDPESIPKDVKEEADVNDPFKDEPSRNPLLIVHTKKPFKRGASFRHFGAILLHSE